MKSNNFMNRRSALVSAALMTLVGTAAHAQSPYPNRPVKLVVPFSAGGSTDLVARQIALEMAARTGQPFVVENKPGPAAPSAQTISEGTCRTATRCCWGPSARTPRR